MKFEPTLKTRREFLRSTVLGSALSWTVPAFLANTFAALHATAADAATQITTGKDGTILVVLQLAGGNDGLNMVVPFADDHYRRARPRLAVAAKDVLRLSDSVGLNPGMAGLKELFEAGHLGVVQGVGYPNPNRSHFRSTEIWQTASDANRFENTGWLGRYFDSACDGCDPAVAIALTSQMPQALAAKQPRGVCFNDPENYRFIKSDRLRADESDTSEAIYRRMNEVHEAATEDSGGTIDMLNGSVQPAGSPLDFIERVALDAQVSSDEIRAVTGKAPNQTAYPASRLADSLKLVARLIGGGMATRIYYVSQGGYDTHTNQVGTHTRLLAELAGALQAFVADLKAQGNFERVLVMTFSEFGRRVSENASGGTDHGAAAPLFVIGNRIKAGLLGRYPSLAPKDLLNGDIQYTVDFRCVYAAVLENWLKTSSVPVLGRSFTPLAIV